ncbi:hypothetical protein E1B28_010869 [Marasmius oreades]|uniref:Uncharacterized protein n=1 Tax=Marasmius oreades TaxID=181124 RepID=A0A9P7URH0_9AGAR|nr:uncharacterized protein E1B28_010869 [Marasmius oreades]KAG7089164.1 hypothetical protein E1B28_010869 [Marasmius oreades]
MPVFHRETSVSAATENISAASNDKGSLLMKFLLLGGLALAATVAAKKWFYPYTIEDLDGRVRYIDTLIKNNMSLRWNILGKAGPGFRRILEKRNDEVRLIKTNMNTEPDRTKIVAWMTFKWSQLHEIKACYLRLRELELDVTVEIEERMRSLRGSQNPLLASPGPRAN